MHESTDDRRVVSVSALVAAMRREQVPDAAIERIVAAALGADDAVAPGPAAAPPPVTDLVTLHAQLAEAQKRGDWSEVVAIIGRILEHERDPARRARYLYTRAIVERDELADHDAALTSLEEALDCDPSMLQAFDRQTALLTARQDWKSLERAHRKMIVRIRGQDDAALEFRLFQALAEIYRDRLGQDAAAIETFKMALRLRPDDAAVLAALQALGA